MKVANPADTYIDTRDVQKGVVWVNGRTLGRFWSVGPQFALYTPAPWLHDGGNDLVFFDLKGSKSDALKSGTEPVFALPKPDKIKAQEAK
jgi:beta-galactosidase